MSLLDLLREQLSRPGSRKGCNWGACGACIVLVVGAAVANAIFNATGKRIRSPTITLDKLL